MAQINLSSKLTIASTSCILLPGIIHLSLSSARRFHPRQKLDRIQWKANDSAAKRTRAFKQIGFAHVLLYLYAVRYLVSLFSKETRSHPIVKATLASYQCRNFSYTSFIRVRFNSSCRIVRIRESSLIVFDQYVHINARTYTYEVYTFEERIFIGKQRSSGWRATVRVSDQLTICRQTRAGSSRR